MGLEANSSSTAAASNSCSMSSSTSAVTQTTVACSSGKRSRDPEDEVYVDNLNSHKRYLSEVIFSSHYISSNFIFVCVYMCMYMYKVQVF